MTGWLNIALVSLTLLGSYVNGIISDLKLCSWMSSDKCVIRVSSDKHSLVFSPTPFLQAFPLHQHPVAKTAPHDDPPTQTWPFDPRPGFNIDDPHSARADTASRRLPSGTDERQKREIAQYH